MAQYRDNLSYINRQFPFYLVPVGLGQYKVGPDDAHLNQHAVDQVMKDLAAQIEQLIPPAR